MPKKNDWVRSIFTALTAGVCGFIILCPYSKAIGKSFFAVIAVLWILTLIISRGRRFLRYIIVPSILNRYFAVLALILAVSTIFSVNPYFSQQIVFSRYLMYFAIFEIGALIVSTDTRAVRAIIYAIIVSSFIFAIGCVVDYVVIRPERLFSAWGILIPFGMGGIYSVYFMPVNYVFFLFYKRKRTALPAMANFIILLPGLVWQLSRAAWIAVASCVLFFSVFRKRVFGACVLAVFISALFLLPAAKVRLERIPNIVHGWGERVPEWEAGLRIFMEHPFVGAGPGMYEKLMFNYEQKFPFTEGRRNSHCHNTYLEVLAETGIAGLSGFLALFIGLGGMVAGYLKRNRRRIGDFSTTTVIALSGSIASTLVFALAGTVITVGINEPLFFWLVMGVLAGIIEEDYHGRDTGKSDR